MTFALPTALLFFGLFVPVILLYLLKQRRRRVEVSTLMFWDKILRDEQTVTSLTRLKKLLSLLLQLIFIALLTLALARPLFSGKWTGARRIVILVDASASMLVQESSGTRFELAHKKAADVVRGMSFGDTAMLVAVGAEPEIAHPFSDSRKDLKDALDKIKPTHGEADFSKAMRLLDELPADERQTHVYLVSDGAFSPVSAPVSTNLHYAFLKVGEASENVGITAFQVRPLPASPRDFQVHIEVANETDKEQKVPLELRIAGKLADAYELTIPSGGVVNRTLRQYSADGGEVEAIIESRDAFQLDNHAYAMLPPPRKTKVALVDTNDLFLERALATDEGVDLTVLGGDDFPRKTNKFDVVVFTRWAPEKTPEGNSIFVATWPSDLGLPPKGALEKPLFTDWDREHPINRHLALQNVSIEKGVAVEKASGFIPLASSFNDPLVLLKESEKQKVLVVTFDPGNSDLPLRIAFPIMIANAIRYLGGLEHGERWQNPPLGSILSARDLDKFNPIETESMPDTVIEPGEKRIPLNVTEPLVAVHYAGFYRGLSGTNEIPLFAANLSSRTESKIKPAEKLPLKATGNAPLAEIKGGFRLGSEPWFFLVLVAMMLSTVEWGLFHRRVIE